MDCSVLAKLKCCGDAGGHTDFRPLLFGLPVRYMSVVAIPGPSRSTLKRTQSATWYSTEYTTARPC